MIRFTLVLAQVTINCTCQNSSIDSPTPAVYRPLKTLIYWQAMYAQVIFHGQFTISWKAVSSSGANFLFASLGFSSKVFQEVGGREHLNRNNLNFPYFLQGLFQPGFWHCSLYWHSAFKKILTNLLCFPTELLLNHDYSDHLCSRKLLLEQDLIFSQ